MKKTKPLIAENTIHLRALGRSENPGVPVLFGGHDLPPLVEIGLTDLPKSGVTLRDDIPALVNFSLENGAYFAYSVLQRFIMALYQKSTFVREYSAGFWSQN